MNPDNAIELKGISLTYTIDSPDTDKKGLIRRGKKRIENRVLDNIDLNVKKGEILGIIGNNGAGKSTLLSIMARILEPDSGTLEISGKVATILELGMGFHPDLTGRENIVLKGELYGFSKKQMESKIEDIIDYSGIRKFIDNPVRTYSSGMRSRLAFSIMIHVDAQIMLVDEILSTGDATFSAKASDFFKKILKDGKTVVYVSHSPGSIETICTRAVWLDKGKIIADGKPKKVCSQYHEASLESLDVILDQAKSGLSDAQYRLAMLYKEGEVVETNFDAYLNWLELAAEQGHIKAQVELADLLMKSDNQDDRDSAVSYYQSAASRGDTTARSRLSIILGRGKIDDNYSEVRNIFNFAANTGNPPDMYRYALFLLKTAWTDDDRAESFRWFKRLSDEFDHPDAIIQLALMYRDGIGTKKNKRLFLKTLTKGSNLGIVKAMNMLADIYSAGILVEEDDSYALSLYEKCAEAGSASCQFTVATMYQDGIGTEPNKDKAEYWFNAYSKSQLIPYVSSAINILQNNDIPDAVDLCKLYDYLESSNDSKALIDCLAHVRSNPGIYLDNADSIISTINEKLSRSYGKGMTLAFQYYGSPDSNGYDPTTANTILRKMIYTGNPELLFNYALLSLKSNEHDNEAVKYIALSARLGHPEAKNYCREHHIKYNE